MENEGDYEIIGETRDDAVGEAYDKVARTIGLPYPGGPQIDKLAQEGEESIEFPRSWLEEDSYDFSFSGLKSSVLNYVHNRTQRGEDMNKADIAASFQRSVVDVLVERAARAVMSYDTKQLILTGGVAANSAIREAMEVKVKKIGVQLIVPPLSLCTDNAAMIGAAAHVEWKKKNIAALTLNGVPNLSLQKR